MSKYIKGYIDVANIKNLSKNGYKLYFCCILLKSSILGLDNFKLTDEEITNYTGLTRDNHIFAILKELSDNNLIKSTIKYYKDDNGETKKTRYVTVINSISSSKNWIYHKTIDKSTKKEKIKQKGQCLPMIPKQYHVEQNPYDTKSVSLCYGTKSVS